MCQECEENKATKYCKDCELKQCEDCVTHMHKLKKRKDHVLISIKEYLSTLNESKEEKPKQEKVVEEKDDSPIGKCLLHPETKIAAYCRTCDEPICTTCLLSNHDGHKKMNLEEAKPISTEEYNNILEDLKDSNSLLTKFKKQLTENNSLALSTLSTYFSNIRKNLDEKEDSLKNLLNSDHSENSKKLDSEIKTHSEMIKRMENEQVFVEQLKIKIDAKKVVSDMKSNESVTLPLTYCFFKNDKIVEMVNGDLDVKEGEEKIMFSKIKDGSLPHSEIEVVDNAKN